MHVILKKITQHGKSEKKHSQCREQNKTIKRTILNTVKGIQKRRHSWQKIPECIKKKKHEKFLDVKNMVV